MLTIGDVERPRDEAIRLHDRSGKQAFALGAREVDKSHLRHAITERSFVAALVLLTKGHSGAIHLLG